MQSLLVPFIGGIPKHQTLVSSPKLLHVFCLLVNSIKYLLALRDDINKYRHSLIVQALGFLVIIADLSTNPADDVFVLYSRRLLLRSLVPRWVYDCFPHQTHLKKAICNDKLTILPLVHAFKPATARGSTLMHSSSTASAI